MAEADNAMAARTATKRQRRAAIRRSHPDLGGSAEQLIRVLNHFDDRLQTTYAPRPEVTRSGTSGAVYIVRTRGYALRFGIHRLRHLLSRARACAPRAWPGARRFLEL